MLAAESVRGGAGARPPGAIPNTLRPRHTGSRERFYGPPGSLSQDGVITACDQPGTQQMLLHGWGLGELGVGTDEHYVFSLVFPHDGIEIA